VPELPEVESLAAFLRERAVGHAFVRADITAISALKTYDPPVSAMVGLLIDDVQRHGKFLDISAQGVHLVIHLARAGWLRWKEEQNTGLVRPGKGPIALRTVLDDGSGFDLTEAGTQKKLAVYVVRDVNDQSAVKMALVENIQREELAPLEEAHALQRLIVEFKLTHQQAADEIGRSRAAVSNLLRLLELPEPIKQLLAEHKLDMGHARALLTLDAKLALGLARQAAEHGWTVRQLEDAARRAQAAPKTKAAPAKRDADIVALERELAEKLAAKVSIQHGRGGGGKLVVSYHSVEELEGILERIR